MVDLTQMDLGSVQTAVQELAVREQGVLGQVVAQEWDQGRGSEECRAFVQEVG